MFTDGRLYLPCQVAYGKYDLAPVQIQWLMYQLVCGVHYLHSLGVMHRDLAVCFVGQEGKNNSVKCPHMCTVDHALSVL